ncbi:MAG: CHASE domain-containing protein [Nitrospirae bacterium]|nr:CHASE domain-containing protein [Nitrospirota bacterium]MBF0505458.1 CHASE domain-containing protein [Nitrospirota bacterium]
MTYTFGNKSFRNILFAVILVLGVALSIIVSVLSYYADKKTLQAEFSEAAENRYSALRREIDSDLFVLTSLQALYYTSGKDVGRSDFRNFTNHILKQHASIQALEWIPWLQDSRREAYERAARREGFPDFQLTERIAQGKMKRAEKRKEYFPAYFVEPYKGNEIALGFDLASNHERLEALEIARKTGEIRATGRITPVQETKSQFGFIVFAPIYRKEALINSDRARWDNLKGFALGVFRISDIAEKATHYLKPEGVDFFIYDSSAPEKERFLYAHPSRTRKTPLLNQDQPETDLINIKTIEVAGRKWMAVYAATPDFIAARSSRRPWGFLLAGLAFTGLVGGFFFIVSHAEHLLTESKQRLIDIIDFFPDPTFVVDNDKKVIVWNIAIEAMTGVCKAEIIGQGDYAYTVPFYGKRTKQLLDLLDERDADIAAKYKDIREKGNVLYAEVFCPALYGGKGAYVWATAAPLFDEKGIRVGGIETIRDITDQVKAKEALRKAYTEVEMKVQERTAELNAANTALTAEIIERKQADEALQESERKYRTLIETTDTGFVILDKNGLVLDANAEYVRLAGHQRLEDILGRSVMEWTAGHDCARNAAEVKKCFEEGSVRNLNIDYIDKDGKITPIEINATVVGRGKDLLVVTLCRDITERKKAVELMKQSLKEKEALLREIHHRVKNNMAVVSSLLSLQSETIENATVRSLFRESQQRVKSMALVHEKLYQTKDLSSINFEEYIKSIISEIIGLYRIDTGTITMEINIEDIELDLEAAVPCGLIINELLTNALKYAFPDNRSGVLSVHFTKAEDTYTLSIKDNGVGLPGGLDYKEARTLGLQLVNVLTRQLRGTFQIKSDEGTEAIVTFKAKSR